MEINGITGTPFEPKDDLFLILDKLDVVISDINMEARCAIWGYGKLTSHGLTTGSMEAALCNHVLGVDIPIFRTRKINDIDLMIPMGTDKILMEVLTKLGIPNKKYGPQVFAMIDIDGVTRQVDFAMKPFFDSRPTEFAMMSSSWYMEDAELNIRAVYHKLLLMSLTAAYDDADALSLAYGIRQRDNKEYICEMEKIVIRLFDRHGDFDIQNRMELIVEAISNEKINHFKGVCELMKSFMTKTECRKVREKFTRKMVDYDKSAKASPEEFDRVWAIYEEVLSEK